MDKEKREIIKKLEVGTTYSGTDVICRQYKEIERLNNIIKEYKVNTIPTLEHNIDELVDSEDRLNNIINELEKILSEKIEAVEYMKETLGTSVYEVNPHIDILEKEYNYFSDKIKELKDSDK